MYVDCPAGPLTVAENQALRCNLPSSPQLIEQLEYETSLLIGCGGHARSLIELVNRLLNGRFLLGRLSSVKCLGYPVVYSDLELPLLREECVRSSSHRSNTRSSRVRLAERLNQLGFQFPVLISPHAVVSRHAQLGPGTTVTA